MIRDIQACIFGNSCNRETILPRHASVKPTYGTLELYFTYQVTLKCYDTIFRLGANR